MLKNAVKILFIILLINSSLFAKSLWDESSKSPYVRNKQLKSGDIISVKILESTTALHEAQTDLEKQSDVNLDISTAWDKLASVGSQSTGDSSRNNQNYKIGGGDDYKGRGQTTRKSSVKAQITVMVKSNLGEGLCEVEGVHKMKVNGEEETIYIKGFIREKDVDSSNTIFSYQIANAQISIEGTGSVSAKQNPGVFSRMFDWLF